MYFIKKILLSLIISTYTTMFLLVLSIFLIISGSVIQIQLGMYAAEKIIFDSWFYWAGGLIPLPGFKTVGILICINLLGRIIKNIQAWIFRPGLLLIHSSILLIITTGIINSSTQKEALLNIREGETVSLKNGIGKEAHSDNTISLPVEIKLDQFTIEQWPGSSKARDYRSTISLYSELETKRSVISMNKPFRYGDCTFYQASFFEYDGKMGSTLFVVKSRTRFFPYVATILFIIGSFLILVAAVKSKKNNSCVSVGGDDVKH